MDGQKDNTAWDVPPLQLAGCSEAVKTGHEKIHDHHVRT